MKKVMIPVVHLEMVKDKEVLYGKEPLDSPEKAAVFMRKFLGEVDREYLTVCCVDAKLKPTCIQIVGIGSINSCTFSIPEIFKAAMLSNAASLFLFHTHPSGEPEPSREDELATQRAKKAGDLLGIALQDHIILGEAGQYYSFREREME